MKKLLSALFFVTPLALSTPAFAQASNAHYPGIGKMVTVNFGGAVFELSFDTDGHAMSFRSVGEEMEGLRETVQYTAVEVARNVYMVHWKEPEIGATVVHVQNWNNKKLWTNITQSDLNFINLDGTFTVSNAGR